MTYDKVGKGELYPKPITFEDAATEMKRNIRRGNPKADQELMKFKMTNQ